MSQVLSSPSKNIGVKCQEQSNPIDSYDGYSHSTENGGKTGAFNMDITQKAKGVSKQLNKKSTIHPNHGGRHPPGEKSCSHPTTQSSINSLNTPTYALARDVEYDTSEDVNPKTFSRSKNLKRRTKPKKLRMKNQSSLTEDIQEIFHKHLPKDGSCEMDQIEKTFDIVESVILMLGALRGTEEPSAMLCIIGQFVKTFVEKSVTSTILRYISSLTEEIEPQDSGSVGSFKGFIDSIKELRSNWTVVMKGPFASTINKFLGILVAVGVYNAADLTFDIKGFKVLEPDLDVVSSGATDLVDHIFSISLFVLERSAAVWKSGNPASFLLGDDESASLDEEYLWIIKNWTHVQTGEYRVGITKAEFDLRLNVLGIRLRDLYRSTPKSAYKAVLERKLSEIMSISNKTSWIDMSSTSRYLPFTFGFFGDSGLGKSFMIGQFIELLCKSASLPHGEGYLYVLKEGQKFWDGWTNNKNAVLMDDYGNKKEPKGQNDGSNVVVDVVNRIPFHPPMAALEDKHNADCHPDIVAYTGHDKTLKAFENSISCLSIQKRCEFAIDVKPRPEFTRIVDGTVVGIDSDKVREYYKDANGSEIDRIIDDTLLYTITTVKPGKDHRYVCDYAVCVHNDRPMKDVSAEDVLCFLIDAFAKHRANEERLAKGLKNRTEKQLTKCASNGCPHFQGHCPYHKDSGTSEVAKFSHEPQEQQQNSCYSEPSDEEQAIYECSYPEQSVDSSDEDISSGSGSESSSGEENDDETLSVIEIALDTIYEADQNAERLELEPEGVMVNFIFKRAMGSMKKRFQNTISRKILMGDMAAKAGTYFGLDALWTRFDWLKFVPTNALRDERFQELICIADADKIYDSFRSSLIQLCVIPCLVLFSYLFHWLSSTEYCLDRNPFWIWLCVHCPRYFEMDTRVDHLYDPVGTAASFVSFLIRVCSPVEIEYFEPVPVEIPTRRTRIWKLLFKILRVDHIQLEPTYTTWFPRSTSIFIDHSYTNFQVHLFLFLLFSTFSVLRLRNNWEAAKKAHIDSLMQRNDVTQYCNRLTRDKVMTHVMAYSTGAAALYICIKLMRALKKTQKIGFEGWIDSILGIENPKSAPDGIIGDKIPTLPTEKLEVENSPATDEQAGVISKLKTLVGIRAASEKPVEVIVPGAPEAALAESEWLEPRIEKIDVSTKCKTMTSEQFEGVLVRNLFHFTIYDIKTKTPVSFGNSLFTDPNVMKFPKHYVKGLSSFTIKLVMNDNPKSTNHSRTFDVYESMMFNREDTDLAYIYTGGCGVLCKDISHMLCPKMLEKSSKIMFNMVYRSDDGAIKRTKGICESGSYKIGTEKPFMGLKYLINQGQCFPGLCGAILYKAGTEPCVLGMHVAGAHYKPDGAAVQCPLPYLKEAKSFFTKKGFYLFSQTAPLNTKCLGKDLEKQSGLHPKHFLNYQKEVSHFECVGCIKAEPAQKSGFTVFPTNDLVKEIFGDDNEYEPPKMSPPWKPYQKFMDKARTPMSIIDPDLMNKALQDYREKIAPVVLSEEWKGKLRPLTDHEALNGIPGRRFMPAWPINTAPGLPLTGNKEPFIVRTEGSDVKELSEAFKAELEIDRQKLRDGIVPNRPVKTFFKDEPHKKGAQKARVVNALSGVTNFEMRRLFLPIIEMIELNPEVFEIAVGTNASNHEWDRIMRAVRRFKSGKIFAGDFSGFDVHLTRMLLVMAIRDVLIWIARQSGNYTEEDIRCMELLMECIINCYVVMDGGIFIPCLGLFISGNIMTAIVNAICNLLLLRAYFLHEYPARSFAEFVGMQTYGDDNVGEVSDDAPNFTVLGFSIFLARFGMKFTRFDKSDEPIPNYYSWEEVDFLKRRSVFHPLLGFEIGALDPVSIYRMMRLCTLDKRSGHTSYTICCTNLSTSLREAFNHGPIFYEDFRLKLIELAERLDMIGHIEGLNLSYEDRVQDWMKRNGKRGKTHLVKFGLPVPRTYHGVDIESEVEEMVDSDGLPDVLLSQAEYLGFEYQGGASHVVFKRLPRTTESQVDGDNKHEAPSLHNKMFTNQIEHTKEQFPELCLIKRDENGGRFSTQEKEVLVKLSSDIDFVSEVLSRSALKLMQMENEALYELIANAAGIVGECRTLRDGLTCLYDPRMVYIQPQSGVPETKTEIQGTMTFADEEQQDVVAEPTFTDPAREAVSDWRSDLGDFFERPVNIYNFTWDVGGATQVVIDPWSLFFENKRVINRIANYSMMRCNLHLKFMVSGNAFYYGRLMPDYLPLPNFDAASHAGVPTTEGHMTEHSQRPHCIINPTTNQGAEMVLPFFWHKNAVSIVDAEYAELGRICMSELSVLLNAAGTTEAITVSIFAWAEDMHLAFPTSVNPSTIVAQAGKPSENDQANAKGVVSHTAGVISKTLARLSSIPSFAPMAMPGSMVFGGISEIAHSYGYSRPLITKAPDPMRPVATGSLACATAPDTSAKLTIEEKQELSVDPRIGGVGDKDELAIASFATREAWIDTASWLTSSPTGTLIWNTRVTPCMWQLNGTGINMTPCCFAAMPFKYWTGCMKLRIEVVCSGFHRGRLMVKYDPNQNSATETNVGYSEVIDITTDTDMTYEIGISQPTNLLPIIKPGSVTTSTIYGTGPLTSNELFNGILSVYVLNELITSNVGISNVVLNFYVSAADDFEVFVPTPAPGNYTITSQSGLFPSGEISNSQSSSIRKFCTGASNSPDMNKVYIGEHVGSLRMLLKRYTLHETTGGDYTGGGVGKFFRTRRCAYPFLRGRVPNAVHSATGPVPYNFCNTLLLHLISLCFSGVRGSIRYKIMARGVTATAPGVLDNSQVELMQPEAAEYLNQIAVIGAYPNEGALGYTALPTDDYTATDGAVTGYAGAHVTGMGVNSVMEFEVPYYSNRRFEPGKRIDWTDLYTPNTFMGFQHRYTQSTNARFMQDHFVSIGEDFQFYNFSGVPTLYYSPVPSLPA